MKLDLFPAALHGHLLASEAFSSSDDTKSFIFFYLKMRQQNKAANVKLKGAFEEMRILSQKLDL